LFHDVIEVFDLSHRELDKQPAQHKQQCHV
jgi:hypothetical protein